VIGRVGLDHRCKISVEISSQLNERASELKAGGAPHPIEQAISSLGDPADLASAFVAVAQAKRGIHSYAPWTLLRSAARVALTGTKGLLVFLMGVIGYGFALAGLVTALLKPFIPKMGFGLAVWESFGECRLMRRTAVNCVDGILSMH
jgi:hypothetical protein